MIVQEIATRRSFVAGDFTFSVDPAQACLEVTSREWPRLNGSHVWWAPKDLWRFLGEMTDRHYLVKKLFDRESIQEIDNKATHRAIFKHLREEVRGRDLTREQATECLGYLQSCSFDLGPVDLRDSIDGFPHLEAVYEHIVFKERHCVEVFWKAWMAFRQHIEDVIIPAQPAQEISHV